MRLAILSDIHGNLLALEAVVRDIQRRSVDAMVNLGDSLSGPLMPRETAQFLMAQDWVHLAGNHERQLLTLPEAERGLSDRYAYTQLTQTELDWLAQLRPSKQYTEEVLLCHGTPSSDLMYLLETVDSHGLRAATQEEIVSRLGEYHAEIILCGHTHIARAVRTRQGTLIVNPGSVGLPAYDDVHPFPHFVETGSPDARYAIVEKRQANWLVDLISVPYAHHQMAQLAEQRQRPDWAFALATGYMPRA